MQPGRLDELRGQAAALSATDLDGHSTPNPPIMQRRCHEAGSFERVSEYRDL